MTIRVAIAGARGRMGQEAVHTIMKNPDMELVSVLDYKNIWKTLEDTNLFPPSYGAPIFTDLGELHEKTKPDVLVDLTSPESVYEHTKKALELRIRPVVGTTGFTDEELEELKAFAEKAEIGCIIAPNFAVGAVLMMKFAEQAAKYLPDVEIIEMHHDQKLDAPSGTALKTANLISSVRPSHIQGHPKEKETIQGARGADYEGMRIHSVRLPGLVAHQQVLLGGEGQLLTIRHDSFNRGSFMSGVVLSVKTVMNLKELVYGLEHIID
ncbi:4-hydroxy-tetrahydrodipicolinate reductase [Planomicrobium sp. CPCC 101110]|uniref:4-hydroxy-tetrahydrodipicolinate reductase n=1 Tax=Planomicrobium sp. CPCC 101110 TaxID=2599619 RepID=UPI0011B5E512|nr:4-hydroxy-tetrahydrodipicolinate reductase [Planomicrobium sp. CPCC 101110]TWT28329.1 4-hydroxy-tetrahydrodipicolinate reductase [Planomicrobium sp. CPCC 101110]